MKRRHHRGRDLHDQPADDRIGDRDLVNIAPLQLGEKVAQIHCFSLSRGPSTSRRL